MQPHYSVNIKTAVVSLPPPTSLACNKDIIYIREGNDTSGELILQLCGKETYQDYKTGYNRLYIGFESDGVNDGKEFHGAFAEYDTGENIFTLRYTTFPTSSPILDDQEIECRFCSLLLVKLFCCEALKSERLLHKASIFTLSF